MADYTLTVFGDDDETPLFEVGTAASHAAPYLRVPEEFGESEVDLLEGTALIGQINVRVIDPQTGSTQAERWLTGRLATEGGYSALNGRRTKLAQVSPAAVLFDGVIGGVALTDSFAGFQLPIRDIRERGRKVKAFARTSTSTVFPRGVLDGYGKLPNGEWLAPPTRPSLGVYHGDATRGYITVTPYEPAFAWEQVLTQRMIDATAGRWSKREQAVVMDRVAVRWRLAASGDPWQTLERLQIPSGESDTVDGLWDLPSRPSYLLASHADTWRTDAGEKVEIQKIDRLVLVPPAGSALPGDGDVVEFVVRYVGEPSDDYPFHFEGSWGELVRNLLRGDYCAEDEEGVRIDPRIRYDEAAILAIDTPVRVRLTEPKEDIRSALEELCKAIGAAPALDADGEISPVLSRLPDISVTLAQVDDSNAQPIPGWEHPASGAKTQVRVTYARDRRVSAKEDPDGTRAGGDGILSQDVTVVQRAPDAVIAVMGEQNHDIDAWMFRALGGERGEPVSGDVADERGDQLARETGHAILDRFAYGGISSFCKVQAADFPDLQVGDWVLDARSWRPNYQTLQRGGSSLAQVVSVKRADEAWWEVRLIDAAPADQPAQPPTLGALSATDAGVVSVPVTAIPTGSEARVDFAISATEPALDSPLWRFLGRTAVPTTLRTPPVPSAAMVWIRARGEAVGKRPSAWTLPVSIGVAGVPRIRSATLSIAEDGTATLDVVANASTQALRIYYQAHAPTVTPALTTSFDVEGWAGTWEIPGTVQPGQMLTVAVEPWTSWDAVGGAVAGSAGPQVVRRAVRGAPDETGLRIHDFRVIREDDATITLGWTLGAALEESWYATRVVPAPFDRDWWTVLAGEVQPLSDGVTEVTVLKPAEGSVRLVQVEGRYEATPGVWAAGGLWRREVYPRVRVPALDPDTGELADAAVKRAEQVADGVLTARTMTESARSFSSDVVFSAPDHQTVAWAAGAVVLADGTRYSIEAGTTGVMTAPTYLYLDPSVSPTALQVTTNVATAVGERKILLCYARPIADATQRAMYVPAVGLLGLNAENLNVNSVNALHIASISLAVLQAQVNQLSALTTDFGEVNSGIINNAAEAPTRGIRLGEENALPATWVDFLDLAATGTDPVLKAGGLQVLANGTTLVLDPVAKVIRISHHGFRPSDDTTEYSAAINNTNLASGTGTSGDFFAPLPIPAGVVITGIRFRGARGDNANTCQAVLYRQNEDDTNTALATATVSTNSDQTALGTVFPSETTTEDVTYLIEVFLSYAAGAAPGFRWVEVQYTSPNYRATY